MEGCIVVLPFLSEGDKRHLAKQYFYAWRMNIYVKKLMGEQERSLRLLCSGRWDEIKEENERETTSLIICDADVNSDCRRRHIWLDQERVLIHVGTIYVGRKECRPRCKLLRT